MWSLGGRSEWEVQEVVSPGGGGGGVVAKKAPWPRDVQGGPGGVLADEQLGAIEIQTKIK